MSLAENVKTLQRFLHLLIYFVLLLGQLQFRCLLCQFQQNGNSTHRHGENNPPAQGKCRDLPHPKPSSMPTYLENGDQFLTLDYIEEHSEQQQ